MEARAAETEPLLNAIEHNPPNEVSETIDIGDDDPVRWPASFKISIVALLATMAFSVTFNCVSVVPIANTIVEDLSGSQAGKSAGVLLITIWELGEAAGPLLIGPLSEAYGRYPVMNIGNCCFIGATVLAALSPSVNTLIAARALTGLAVVVNVLNPAVVGDIFAPESRGSAMSFVQLAPLIGGATGPAISGAITQTLGWRRVMWMSVALATACEVVFLTYFKETYRVQIQRRQAKSESRSAGEAIVEDEGDRWWRLAESIRRPFVVFGSSGVLMATSLFGGVCFAHYYVMSVTLPQILQEIYDLSPALTGLSMISCSIGSTIAVLICNQSIDRIYINLRDRNGGKGEPEFRLPLVILGGFLIPVSVALYGWIAELRLPVAALMGAVALIGASLMFCLLPVSSYVVDAFGDYSASALTGLIVFRCLMATFLPLTTTPLVEGFGWGWGFTILAAGTLMLAPIPMLLMRYGGQWRERCKYSRSPR